MAESGEETEKEINDVMLPRFLSSAEKRSQISAMYSRSKNKTEHRKVVLLREPRLHKLAAAWSAIEREDKLVREGSDVWTWYPFSFDNWCSAAGLPVTEVNLRSCERLIRQGLVLPDGRLAYWVAQYLDTRVQALFQAEIEDDERRQ